MSRSDVQAVAATNLLQPLHLFHAYFLIKISHRSGQLLPSLAYVLFVSTLPPHAIVIRGWVYMSEAALPAFIAYEDRVVATLHAPLA